MTANLLSRLQGLTAPDREVDAALWLEFAPGATRKQWSYIHTATGRECHVDETRDVNGRLIIVPELTSSLDAAVALCERVLPGWSWECRASGTGDKGQATVWNPSKAPGYNEEQRAYNCATPAIALLIAILTALEDRENG